MATKVNEKQVLNNALKEEHKSLSSLIKSMKAKKESSAMKDFLNRYSLTFEQLINFDYFKGGLKMGTFVNSEGKEFTTIARTHPKTKELVQAKWSFWLVLSAAIKVRKEELKKAEKAAKEAKEKSLEAIQKEEGK